MAWRHWLHVAVGVVGLLVVVVGLAWVGQGEVTCRGEVMGPGDVCRKGTLTDPSSDEVQTYEQRLASARASRPTVVGLGLGLVGFSAVLLVTGRHRGGRPPATGDPAVAQSASSDIGP